MLVHLLARDEEVAGVEDDLHPAVIFAVGTVEGQQAGLQGDLELHFERDDEALGALPGFALDEVQRQLAQAFPVGGGEVGEEGQAVFGGLPMGGADGIFAAGKQAFEGIEHVRIKPHFPGAENRRMPDLRVGGPANRWRGGMR